MIDQKTRVELENLKQGLVYAAGTVQLASSPATSTSVTRTGVSETSVVHLTARSSTAAQSDIVRVVPANGSFVVTHGSSSSTRVFGYSIHTPR